MPSNLKRRQNVCALVIDRNSGRGFLKITDGGFADQVITTAPDKMGYAMLEIQLNQGFMIYGRSTILYIRPRTNFLSVVQIHLNVENLIHLSISVYMLNVTSPSLSFILISVACIRSFLPFSS